MLSVEIELGHTIRNGVSVPRDLRLRWLKEGGWETKASFSSADTYHGTPAGTPNAVHLTIPLGRQPHLL